MSGSIESGTYLYLFGIPTFIIIIFLRNGMRNKILFQNPNKIDSPEIGVKYLLFLNNLLRYYSKFYMQYILNLINFLRKRQKH